MHGHGGLVLLVLLGVAHAAVAALSAADLNAWEQEMESKAWDKVRGWGWMRRGGAAAPQVIGVRGVIVRPRLGWWR